ncbi:MAG: hypothetical protein HRT73_07430 [Flavobacteriales bacterium]|nr:hypothetical protein [Flavobacteriales bacterium]
MEDIESEQEENQKLFRLAEIKTIIPFISLFAGAVYFIGFVIVNSFLSNYEHFDDNLLNTKYLISGLLFCLFICPLIGIIHSTFEYKTDESTVLMKSLFNVIHNILLYAIVVSLIMLDRSSLVIKQSLIIHCIFFGYLALRMLYSQVKSCNKFKKPLFILLFAIAIGYHIYTLMWLDLSWSLFFLIVMSGMTFTMILVQVGGGLFQKGQLFMLVFTILATASFFGTSVYDKIPNKFGGNTPIDTDILIKESKRSYFNKIGVPVGENLCFRTEILYSTTEEYIFRLDSNIYIVNKDLFNGFKPLKREKEKESKEKILTK